MEKSGDLELKINEKMAELVEEYVKGIKIKDGLKYYPGGRISLAKFPA